MPSKRKLFTIGHSTHPVEKFLWLLARHDIKALVDIRRFPGSRKFPQFNQENLASDLKKAGIDYHWLEALGGRRGKRKDGTSTVNLGLRNASFRNYADYMLTPEFQEGVARMLEVAKGRRTALMCAEGLFWRCHRRLVSDFLVANRETVQHIMPSGELRPHTLMKARSSRMGESLIRVNPKPGPLDAELVRRYLTNMKTVLSSKGQIVLPSEIRQQDDLEPGQEFEVRRLDRGEYLLKRTKRRRNQGLVQLLLACPAKGWFQPANRKETTDDISVPKFE
jgi:AbrB family looped-hinge helix DNA binding protein